MTGDTGGTGGIKSANTARPLKDPMAKILIAASPEPRAIVERILVGHELSCAQTLAEAERFLLAERYDLIICTIAFDESRMFDLLRLAKSTPQWEGIPFACARVRDTILSSPSGRQAAAFTCEELGADAFLDIADYAVDPEREMREAVERLLATSRD